MVLLENVTSTTQTTKLSLTTSTCFSSCEVLFESACTKNLDGFIFYCRKANFKIQIQSPHRSSLIPQLPNKLQR